MSGVQLKNCSDAGGGQNVGWVDAGDWMIYPVDLPFAGDYTVSYRVASQNGGGHFRLDANAGSVIL
ncbi:MAG TPA: peptidase, partial [Cytophagales bacterium]|nr:peptidase [Cytophagales bacterium]